MPSSLRENAFRLWVFPLQLRIINLKKPLAKLWLRLESKLLTRIMHLDVDSQDRTTVKVSHKKHCYQLLKVKKD